MRTRHNITLYVNCMLGEWRNKDYANAPQYYVIRKLSVMIVEEQRLLERATILRYSTLSTFRFPPRN